jgi:hypothetical protein
MFMTAFEDDIRDVEKIDTTGKYAAAIKQMRAYASSIDPKRLGIK